jgi:hypothetical protein
MSQNECLSCPTPCCLNFKIRQEITAPEKVRIILNRYPFIHQTDNTLIYVYGHERLVGIYNCDRFNKTTNQCQNYHTQERPDFCNNTGIISSPHHNCLLKKHPTL